YQDKIATLVLVYDITEKLKAQRELQQRAAELVASNRELEQFAYIASHDLQEPLRMVSSFLQLLEKKNKEKLDATSIQYINFAVDGAERMKGLIKDLLDFSKIGTKNEKKETIDLEKVVQQVLEFFQYEITTSNIHVIVTPRLPVVYAHGTQMQQLFQNLISNAIKYRHSQRSLLITIEVTELSDEYKFSISDNGIGIDPEFFEKIFVVFKRLHRKDEYSGSGIGLAICKKIVELHGGKIWVESKPDIGTTFYFTLPAVHA
ncbi:MAG TPA: ATP-binding protein, partial [Flavisolibacter sp.]|nr:ATP-binding protein [Flavisolibacter sp.]